MIVFGSDQLSCSLVQNHSHHNSINYVLSRLDGTILNEIGIGEESGLITGQKTRNFSLGSSLTIRLT